MTAGAKWWTDREKRRAVAMCQKGLRYAEIAKRLGRSEQAVYCQLKRMKATLPRVYWKPWTPQEEAQAIALFKARCKYTVIAKRMGKNRWEVAKKLNRLGYQRRHASTPEEWAKVRQLHAKGLLLREIAEQIGRTCNMVRLWCWKMGLRRRGNGKKTRD